MDNNTAGQRFDINPPNTYGNGSSVEDVTKGGVNNVCTAAGCQPGTPVETTDLCTEKWYITDTAISCVEIKATVKRQRNTGDTAHDINLSYSNIY